MTRFFWTYMGLWIAACMLAITLSVTYRSGIDLFQRSYWRLLGQPWKLATFAIATIGLVVMAPFTGDPTWDYVDAAFMSIFTYATAPWTIGTLYQALRGRRRWYCVYVAVCLWMFSASWSYDLYILLRDGMYPNTWLANIFASSVIYIAAGLLWNLEWIERRGVIFGFMEDSWPAIRPGGHVSRLFWFAIPFILLVAAMFLPFLF